jgi:mono/diheme cytochrome c family protein
VSGGVAPQYTKEQAEAGKVAYNANCAVCHGSTMTNGTFGTPLAGQYFKEQWTGKPASAFFTHAKTMPPANPGSLPDATYANIVAYILETNGVPAGAKELPATPDALKALTIK